MIGRSDKLLKIQPRTAGEIRNCWCCWGDKEALFRSIGWLIALAIQGASIQSNINGALTNKSLRTDKSDQQC